MKVLIFGASSAIALACARLYAEQQASIILVGRNEVKLSDCEKDLLARGARHVEKHTLDLANINEDTLRSLPKLVDVLLCAHGVLGDQAELSASFEAREALFQINYISCMHILSYYKKIWLENAHPATMAVISSVAGDRGRASNYYYGASKAALSSFLSGLRAELFNSRIHVLSIQPGFVDTPMTAHIKKGPLFASPQTVAIDILTAIEKRKDILYTPFFWRWIMLIVRSLPEFIFKRLKF